MRTPPYQTSNRRTSLRAAQETFKREKVQAIEINVTHVIDAGLFMFSALSLPFTFFQLTENFNFKPAIAARDREQRENVN